ncbi:MAG: hypothetical protein GY722_16715 [bacterium]|nr:hypothetical protein [bacterium]
MKLLKVYSKKELDRVIKAHPENVDLLALPCYLDSEVEPGTAEIWSEGKLTETVTAEEAKP